MFGDWQLLVSLGITALAAAYVVRRLWLVTSGTAVGCASCSRCPLTADTKHRRRIPIVKLETGARQPPRRTVPASESDHV